MKAMLITVLLVMSMGAFAKDNSGSGSSSQDQIQLQGQEQYQSQYVKVSGSSATAGGSSSSVSINQDRTASSAIAPSVSQYSDCPIVSPSSKAGSIFLFSASGTTGQSINGICVAKFLGETDVMRKIACANSKDYHDANPEGCAAK